MIITAAMQTVITRANTCIANANTSGGTAMTTTSAAHANGLPRCGENNTKMVKMPAM